MKDDVPYAICCEPALPRRKKHPELAYRSHEVLRMANGGESSSDSLDDSQAAKDMDSRARSELRSQSRDPASPRSKSVDPYLGRRRPLSAVVQLGISGAGIPSSRQQLPLEHRILYRRIRIEPELMTQSFPPAVQGGAQAGANGPQSESIPKLDQTVSNTTTTPRKSMSMSAIKVDKQADRVDNGQAAVEEEIIVAEKVGERLAAVNMQEEHHHHEPAGDKRKPKKFKTEYKSKFKPPSKYVYSHGVWKPMSRSADSSDLLQDDTTGDGGETWVEEVAELRRKAGEYKCRSVVGNFPIPNNRQEMIEQVSLRTNLSALALATTPSSLKETKHTPSGEVDGQLSRTQQSIVRHHLERTTPTSGDSGVLITSPTRDHKLEPVQLHRHRSSKKESKTRTQRSASSKPDEPSTRASSITPTGRTSSATSAHKSPKRAARPMSMIVPGTKSVVNGTWNGTSSQETVSKSEVKQTRPTTLATSTTTRPKTTPTTKVSSEAVPKLHSSAQLKAPPTKAVTKEPKQRQVEGGVDGAKSMVNGSDEQSLRKEDIDDMFRNISRKCQETLENSRNKQDDELRKEIEETIKLKSPPEPTRVKSPEQVIVKSPETVNWTIPLETRIKWTSGPPKVEDENERLIHSERIRSPPMMMSPVQNPPPVVTSQPPAEVDRSDIINQNGIDEVESLVSSENLAM